MFFRNQQDLSDMFLLATVITELQPLMGLFVRENDGNSQVGALKWNEKFFYDFFVVDMC